MKTTKPISLKDYQFYLIERKIQFNQKINNWSK